MDHHRSPLGHLAFPRPLDFDERAELETLSHLWRVGDGCTGLVLAAATSLDRVVVDLRWIVRHFCKPRDLGLQGVVVLETRSGLYAVTAAGRRVRCRALGPAVTPMSSGPPEATVRASGSGAGGATAECRVIHLDQHRHRLRTAPRDRTPERTGDRPGDGPDGGGWSS